MNVPFEDLLNMILEIKYRLCWDTFLTQGCIVNSIVNYQENHFSDITYISSSCKLNDKDLKISLKQLDICNLIWKKMSLFFLRGVFHQYYDPKEKNISNVNEQFLCKENTNENLLMSLLKKNNKRFVIFFFLKSLN
jgi:hypothetical protein